MVRQKSRKTVEELYNAVPPPPPLATSRFDDNFFQNSKNNKSNKTTDKAIDINVTCRKKSKGPFGGAEKKDEKTFINEERLFNRSSKLKKCEPFISSSLDNKNMNCFAEGPEKDEDTEEFFDLIRETVENAVGKTLSDILSRNFKEVSSKIDNLREQLHSNEDKLEKIQTEMNNSKAIIENNLEGQFNKKKLANKTLGVLPEIVHYGEENSRHFRYLCMKSEYDKMFYQHQNIMTALPVDSRPNVINPYPPQYTAQGQTAPHTAHLPPPGHSAMQHVPQQMQQQTQQPATVRQPSKCSDFPSQCNCHNHGCNDFGGERSKTSMSTKSSEMGIKEVKELLEQLQKFYDHQQTQEKDTRKDGRGDISLNIQDDSGDGDEDDSSDELSSASIEEKLGAGGDS